MTLERWIALSYAEQKKALVDAVCAGEQWDWPDTEVWRAFFESSPEADFSCRRFVDVTRLRNFFGNSELDDFDNDMGMDSFQYQVYAGKLWGGIETSLFNSDESPELPMLDSLGAVFVTRESCWISARDSDGTPFFLRFTFSKFSDRRDDLSFGPFDDQELHDQIDELGEWLEVDGEKLPEIYTDQDLIDSIPDVEVPEIDRDMEFRLRWGDEADSEEGLSIPGFDESTESPSAGLGDKLFE
jgi:hypothetical protein